MATEQIKTKDLDVKEKSDFVIHKKYNFPDKFSVMKLADPVREDYQAMELERPEWLGEEMKHLFWFKQVYKQDESKYNLCYCGNCQTDKYFQKPNGEWWYRQPKVRIPFRLFVAMCFSNFYILCDECHMGQVQEADRTGLMDVGIPIDFVNATMDNWKVDLPFQKTMLEGAQLFVRDYQDSKGILLSGATGTGKTRLACTILAQLFKHFEGNVKMKFVSFHSLIQAGTLSDEKYRELVNVDLLCMDDFVKRNVGYEFGKTIYPLINERHYNGNKTIITTNMSMDEDMLGSDDDNLQRLGDRFKDYIRRETFSEPSQRGK